MRLVVLAVGKLKAGYLQVGCDDYLGRLQRHFPSEIKEIRDTHRRDGVTPERCKALEAEGLRAATPQGASLVLLDERGRSWDSRGFARWLGEQRDRGVATLAFALGGPDGHDATLRRDAPVVWSLGPLTLPHELARLVLLEQLYRAATLLAGAPYHRD